MVSVEKTNVITMSNFDPDGRFQQKTAKNDSIKMQKRSNKDAKTNQ